MDDKRLRIAVIGSGVAGITSALLLQDRHDVTILEAGDRVGGHTNTIVIPGGPDKGLAVDTGFIVLNDKTYPTFHRLLRRLGVPWRWSDMSFGFICERTGLQYAGTNLSGLFAQRRNLANPRFHLFLLEISRFCRSISRDLDRGLLGDETLGQYLRRHRHSAFFVENYILPMAAAIWSTAAGRILQFPAETLATFFRNHGLLSVKDRPRWQTVVGGSHSYVKAFLAQFPGTVRLSSPARRVRRTADGVFVRAGDGPEERFDRVVIAAHADQAMRMLADPSDDERRLLGAWRYNRNETVLHTDSSVLPPLRAAWASWNYRRRAGLREDRQVSLTYHMNRLQGFRASREYCVTLNDTDRIREDRVVRKILYTHPLYTPESRATQEHLPRLNGERFTYFCGSYFGYGFHEDAVKAGAAVGQAFGCRL